MDELLTTQELAERLKVTTKTIQRMVSQGRLPVLRVAGSGNGHPRFIWQDVVDTLRIPARDAGDRGDG